MMTSRTTSAGSRSGGYGDGAGRWPVASAKARFSELIDRAVSDGPQVITRNGRETAVVVSAAEWARKTARPGNLAEFFAASPLRESGLQIERTNDPGRPIDL